MNVTDGDFNFVRRVALGEIQLDNKMDHIKDLRSNALWRFYSSFDPIESEKVLKEIAQGQDKEYADIATQVLEAAPATATEITTDPGSGQESHSVSHQSN